MSLEKIKTRLIRGEDCGYFYDELQKLIAVAEAAKDFYQGILESEENGIEGIPIFYERKLKDALSELEKE